MASTIWSDPAMTLKLSRWLSICLPAGLDIDEMRVLYRFFALHGFEDERKTLSRVTTTAFLDRTS